MLCDWKKVFRIASGQSAGVRVHYESF